MNRAGFFKAIGGAIAAVAGFKPVVKAKSLFNFKVKIIEGANPDVFNGELRLLHAYCSEDEFPRLRKAMDKETKRMQEDLPKIIEQEREARMSVFNSDPIYYDTPPIPEDRYFRSIHAKRAGYDPDQPNPYIEMLKKDENEI